MSIFISIASYRDPMLPFTVARALATARAPGEIHFGIVDQSPSTLPGLSPQEIAPARVSYMRIDQQYARGPCWARAIAMTLYDGEDWFLQLDSHMDFAQDWDQKLIVQTAALMPGRKGVVVSSYPNSFVFENGQPVLRPSTMKVLAHVVKPGLEFDPEHLVLSFEAHPAEQDEPVPGFHLGAGCLFAPGNFAQEFPYDPRLYFHGEEQALAARVFTHGWDIFHMSALPIYHLYNNADAGVPPRPMHWDSTEDAVRPFNWWQLEVQARARLAALLAGEPLGVYSLGTDRTMADYAAFCGIDYVSKTISPLARKPMVNS